MLTFSKLSKQFGPKTLFKDISLRIQSGERIGLVGPNGAGKTTLFSTILGNIESDSGKVELERGPVVGFHHFYLRHPHSEHAHPQCGKPANDGIDA